MGKAEDEGPSQYKDVSYQYTPPPLMSKIRRPEDMSIPMPRSDGLYIETGPRIHVVP